MEALKQPQYAPYALEEQVALLFLAVNGYLMDVEVGKIGAFTKAYLVYLNKQCADLMRSIGETGQLAMEQESTLRAALDSFTKQYSTPVVPAM